MCETIRKRGLKKKEKTLYSTKEFLCRRLHIRVKKTCSCDGTQQIQCSEMVICSLFIILQFSFHSVQQRQSLGECYVTLRRSDFPWNAFNHCKTHTLSSQTGKNTQLAKHTCSRTRCCVIHERSNFPK